MNESSIEPWVVPFRSKASAGRSGREAPNRANSMAINSDDLPDPMSPARRIEPCGKAIVSEE